MSAAAFQTFYVIQRETVVVAYAVEAANKDGALRVFNGSHEGDLIWRSDPERSEHVATRRPTPDGQWLDVSAAHGESHYIALGRKAEALS